MQSSEMTVAALSTIFKNQRGLCAISGKLMTTHGDWKVGLERIDNSKGYTKANSVLICQEFNSCHVIDPEGVEDGCQWTIKKYGYIKKVYNEHEAKKASR